MPVRRLYILCEGQTEEAFVDRVLREHFRDASGTQAIPILPSNKTGSNSRRYKGGWTSYAKARVTLHRLMEQDHGEDTWFTTMLDLYAIPDDFPGLRSAPSATAAQRVDALEAAFADGVKTDRLWRFTPYLQLHEFEALLLADIDAIARSFPDEAATAAAALSAEVGGCRPEEVDGGRETAPSKLIIRHFPAYGGAKVSAGPIIVAEIGLSQLRSACPHFDRWLATLEGECSG